ARHTIELLDELPEGPLQLVVGVRGHCSSRYSRGFRINASSRIARTAVIAPDRSVRAHDASQRIPPVGDEPIGVLANAFVVRKFAEEFEHVGRNIDGAREHFLGGLATRVYLFVDEEVNTLLEIVGQALAFVVREFRKSNGFELAVPEGPVGTPRTESTVVVVDESGWFGRHDCLMMASEKIAPV